MRLTLYVSGQASLQISPNTGMESKFCTATTPSSFFQTQHICPRFFQLTASEGQTKGGETEGKGNFSTQKMAVVAVLENIRVQTGTVRWLSLHHKQSIKWRGFALLKWWTVTELFHLPILRVSVLEATSPCHRLVYPFLSQVNCSGGTWSQCSAVLCRGCLLTIRILQMREKYPCQHPPSQCRRLSSYRPSLMHSRTREEQKKLAGEQTFWKPSFSKTMWIR